jgi:3-hydroxyisobutyrate dehydrogenase/glyoxylate/succinic semialdehyde reductase
MHKDLNLAAATAYEQGVALPMVNTAKEVYGLAIRQGYGPKDFSAIFEYLVSEQRES